MGILTMLVLPIPEHEISFHLFVSFINVLKFQVYRSFTSLVILTDCKCVGLFLVSLFCCIDLCVWFLFLASTILF